MPRKKDELLRNVSSTHEEKYQTWDGNVTVARIGRAMWSVFPRGGAPFTVSSKKEAFDRAIRIAPQNNKPPQTSWKRERLFIGNFPTGISFADRERERGGDYLKLAFLPYRTLELEWAKGVIIPSYLREIIEREAKKLQDRRGEDYQVSTSGQTVRLGS